MSPFPTRDSLGISRPEPIVLPLISYLSYPFEFWRGGLTFKFQVVATSLQTGKLFFGLSYGATTLASGDIIAATSQYGAAFEINQGSNEFEYTVPYVANTPYLNVPNSNLPGSIGSMGLCGLYVMNPLVSPNNTPLSININVFVAGAKDYELHLLGWNNNFIPVGNYPNQILSQSATENVAPLQTTTTNTIQQDGVKLSPTKEITLREQRQFGSCLESLKQVLQKYQMIYCSESEQGDMRFSDTQYLVFPVARIFRAVPLLDNKVQEPANGLLNWASHLFRQYRGNVRFKVQVYYMSENGQFVNIPVQVGFTPTQYPHHSFATNLGPTWWPITNDTSAFSSGNLRKYRGMDHTRIPILYSGINQGFAEFEVPYSSVFRSVLVHTGPSEEYLNPDTFNTSNSLGALIIVPQQYHPESPRPPPANASIQIKIWAALADESKFGNLFQIPPIIINSWDGENPCGSDIY
jgi:hypothetical protein